jgi:hypothetical protein
MTAAFDLFTSSLRLDADAALSLFSNLLRACAYFCATKCLNLFCAQEINDTVGVCKFIYTARNCTGAEITSIALMKP